MNVKFGFRIKEELQEDEKEMLKNMSEIRKLDRTRLPCLRKVEKGKLVTEVRKVNQLLKKIELKDMTVDNDLFYQGAALVTKFLKRLKQKVRRNSLGGTEDWKVKLKSLTKIWGD